MKYLRFNLGKLVFPILEPIFQFFDNRGSDVRKYLNQGLNYLDRGEIALALLSLNMVLNLRPNHILGLISRGRLYLQAGRLKLAAQDMIKANQLSPYRFIHYCIKNK